MSRPRAGLPDRYPKSRMSFLDNLESNLKALESRSERDPEAALVYLRAAEEVIRVDEDAGSSATS